MTAAERRLREHLAATQSQVKAAMGVLRTTNQLLAQALELLDQASTAKEAQHHGHTDRHPAAVG